MLTVLRDAVTSSDKTALVTLHDGALALNLCDRLYLLSDGRLAGVLSPKTDPIAVMEPMLCQIYGNISLHRCTDRTGHPHLVMLKEADE
jgi:iron complex transport system ATP-binding protein